jgi:hypothetical protein
MYVCIHLTCVCVCVCVCVMCVCDMSCMFVCPHYVTNVLLHTFNVIMCWCVYVWYLINACMYVCIHTHIMHIYVYMYVYVCVHYIMYCFLQVCT